MTIAEPQPNCSVGRKSKRTIEISVPRITEQLVVKFLRMLSPYLITAATSSPPDALSTTSSTVGASKPAVKAAATGACGDWRSFIAAPKPRRAVS